MATRFGAHWSVTCYDDVIAAFDVTYSGVFTNSVRGRGQNVSLGTANPHELKTNMWKSAGTVIPWGRWSP